MLNIIFSDILGGDMNFESIHAFLAVVQYGSISRAAKHLYTSQSNISSKIMDLEEEMHKTLILRNRGMRSIQLSHDGEQFYKIALQIKSSLIQLENLKKSPDRKFISIGAVDVINTFTFVPFYQKLINEKPWLCLSVNTYHSTEIYSRMETGDLDFGIVSNVKPHPEINAAPLFKEPMFLLCSNNSSYYNGISPTELNPSKELYIRWSSEFERWHNEYWPNQQYLAQLSTGTMIPHYLTEKDQWCITGISTAIQLTRSYPLSLFKLSVDPPKKDFYMIANKNARNIDPVAKDTFLQSLIEFLQSNLNLECEITYDFLGTFFQ